jgi:DNA-binding IclR family transcriptional regulator
MSSSVLIKTFAIVEALASEPEGIALKTLAQRVGMTKPTTHRILGNLVKLGYAESSSPGEYHLTAKLSVVADRQIQSRLLSAARAVIKNLHDEIGHTVNLAVLRGDRVIYLAVLESKQKLGRVVAPLSTDPFHTTALGRSILAFLPRRKRERLLADGKVERRTARTIVDKGILMATLDRIREDGYALEGDQTDIGIMCIGAPIFDDDQPIGAISVSIPSRKFDPKIRERLISSVCQAAAEITSNLT